MNYYLEVIKKYAVFNGRARRAEFWYFTLFNIIISIILGAVGDILSGIYFLAILTPSIAVAVRRLHDTNRSGLWLLIGLIPFLGIIVLFVFSILDSQPGENQYGSNPKGVNAN